MPPRKKFRGKALRQVRPLKSTEAKELLKQYETAEEDDRIEEIFVEGANKTDLNLESARLSAAIVREKPRKVGDELAMKVAAKGYKESQVVTGTASRAAMGALMGDVDRGTLADDGDVYELEKTFVPLPEAIKAAQKAGRQYVNYNVESEKGTCDFCALKMTARWVYPAKDFVELVVVRTADGQDLQINLVSTGSWQACEDCADAIERQDWEYTATKAMGAYKRKRPNEPPEMSSHQNFIYHNLHQAFDRNRTGNREPYMLSPFVKDRRRAITARSWSRDRTYMRAYNLQSDIAAFWRDPRNTKFAGQFIKTQSAMYYEKIPSPSALMKVEFDLALHADTYWVAGDMCQVLEMAVPTMSPTVAIRFQDLPTPRGWAVFDLPLEHIDVPGFTDAGLRVLTWSCEKIRWEDGSLHDGIHISAYSVNPDHRSGLPVLIYKAGMSFDDPLNIEAPLDELEVLHRGLVPTYKALFTLLRQTIVDLTDHHADRAAKRRRLNIEKKLVDLNPIKVVTLRQIRHSYDDDEREDGPPIEWSCRWMVDFHWRAAYRPKECERCRERRRACGNHDEIPIWPYIKGPDDKPLIIKERVFKWER